jgi:hypothetical protein
MVKVLAKALNVTLRDDWKKTAKGWYDAINTNGSKGIELKEIKALLKKTDSKLHDLADVIRSLGKK